MRLTPALIHSGVQASPDARNAALKMKFAANARLNTDSQRMLLLAISRVTTSNPNTAATGSANKSPNTVTSNESTLARTSDAMVTRLASR